MRRSIIQCVFQKELTELLRNRRSLMVMFGVPLLLYPILTISVASLQQNRESEMSHQTAQILVVNGSAAPKLMKMFDEPDSGINAKAASPATTQPELDSGHVDAVLMVPRNYEAEVIAGRNVSLEEDVDKSRANTRFVEEKLNSILDAYQQWILEQRLAAHNLPADLAVAPERTTNDVATGVQRFGAVLSYVLPLLLLLTGMLGALYPALGATTTERELGTLETLLVTPATRGELLTAKAGIVLLSGLLTAFLNMVSMSLVFQHVMSQAGKASAGLSIDPWALALSYLAAVPTLIFFTSLVLMVGLLARNLREANAYATPLMMVPITSMLVGIADPATTPGLLVTPVANTTLIIKDVLTGHATFGAFALAFVSAGLYAGLVLSLAGRLFTNEQLVNPAWEPLSLRGLTRRPRRPRWPAVDEALCLFAVSLLLNFYLSASWVKHGLLPLLAGVEILLIAGPAVVFAWRGHYPWREVFSLRRPSVAAILGAILIGAGMFPLMSGLNQLQQWLHILPANPADMEGMTNLFEPALRAHPFLAPVIVGLLAGVCEELLFRGPIHAALVRRFSLGFALSLGALLFAAAHLDLSGLPERFILGVILGWLVWRSGSIFPAMLMHAVYDGTSVGYASYGLMRSINTPPTGPLMILAGVAASVVGWILIRTKPAEPRRVFSQTFPESFPLKTSEADHVQS